MAAHVEELAADSGIPVIFGEVTGERAEDWRRVCMYISRIRHATRRTGTGNRYEPFDAAGAELRRSLVIPIPGLDNEVRKRIQRLLDQESWRRPNQAVLDA